ncbi:MAG: MFS transporter [Pseudomonadota bacterium]
MDRRVPYVLAACTGVSILSTDLIAPSIPDLPAAFDTDIRTAQSVVAVNLLAYAVAQLVHGPVAEAFGRRGLLLVSLALFSGVSLLCAFSPTIQALLVGRFAQGLLSSVPSVVVVLIIRELYAPARAMQVMALYGFTIGAAPALGPLIGGYLQIWIGWQAGFVLTALLAALAATAVASLVPETLTTRRPLEVRGVTEAYRELLLRPAFLRQAVSLGLAFGSYFAWVTTAPVIFRESFGLSPERFGYAALLVVGAYMIGSGLAARLGPRLGPERLFRGSLIVLTGALLVLAALTFVLPPNLPAILGLMAVYGFGFAGVMAAGPLVALDAASGLAQGPASALIGACQLGAAALAGFLSGGFYAGGVASMTVTMAGLAVLALLSAARSPRG